MLINNKKSRIMQRLKKKNCIIFFEDMVAEAMTYVKLNTVS